jgi:hypothetical protein
VANFSTTKGPQGKAYCDTTNCLLAHFHLLFLLLRIRWEIRVVEYPSGGSLMTLWGMEMELLCSDGAEDNVEDTELTSGEGTDHDATSWETLGAQVHVASLSGDVAETSHHGAGASCTCLVHLGESVSAG